MSEKTISFIIPAYNEEKVILKTLCDVTNFFLSVPHEIIVVIDGCTDETINLVNEFKKTHSNVVSVEKKERQGKGKAIISGILESKGSIIVIIDADNSVSLKSVKQMIGLVSDSGFDGVIASRYVSGSKILIKQPLSRRILSRGFNLLVKVMFRLKYKDTQCGCKVMRSDMACSIIYSGKSTGFVFDVEMLWRLKQQGYYIPEIPVEWTHHKNSSIKLKRDVFKMFYELIKLRIVTLNERR